MGTPLNWSWTVVTAMWMRELNESQSSASAANDADHRVTSPCATSELKEGKVLPCQRRSY